MSVYREGMSFNEWAERMKGEYGDGDGGAGVREPRRPKRTPPTSAAAVPPPKPEPVVAGV